MEAFNIGAANPSPRSFTLRWWVPRLCIGFGVLCLAWNLDIRRVREFWAYVLADVIAVGDPRVSYNYDAYHDIHGCRVRFPSSANHKRYTLDIVMSCTTFKWAVACVPLLTARFSITSMVLGVFQGFVLVGVLNFLRFQIIYLGMVYDLPLWLVHDLGGYWVGAYGALIVLLVCLRNARREYARRQSRSVPAGTAPAARATDMADDPGTR